METKGWKITAIIFIVLFSLAFLTAWWNIEARKSSDMGVRNCYDNIAKDYDYKCGIGYTRQCAPVGKSVYYCNEGQYSLCYDTTVQSGVVCNKLDNVDAVCMPRGANWIKCPTGSYAQCYDYTTGKYVNSI